MLNRAVRQIAALAGALIVICIVCRIAMSGAYTAYIPLRQPKAAEDLRFAVENPEVMAYDAPKVREGYAAVRVRPRTRGETFLNVFDEDGELAGSVLLRVGRFGTVYDVSAGGFSGDIVVLISAALFFLLVSAIMVKGFVDAKGPAFYAYTTILFAGFSLFSLLTGLELLLVTARHLLTPHEYTMLSAYSAISSASARFMVLTLPLIVFFAAAMVVSNIELLRHERPCLQNVLSILVSVLLVAGEALGLYLMSRDFAGSEWEYRVRNTIENVYATFFVYFECILAGAVVCGLKAARHRPSQDRDFIIILGCLFRMDGTLTPLLRGRVDRAIEFWRRQKEETGRVARFIPSGGQGPGEVMPEAEAMKRYLLSQGIPEALICPEDQSRNTYQNMEYSKNLIESIQPEGKAVYVTTNYHVFRSGLWASLAGLSAEGAGSRTKWWYWPNAFMRECVGLMRNRIRQEILLLIALVAFFSALSMILY